MNSASRSTAITNLFTLLENKFGNIPTLVASDIRKVITRTLPPLSSPTCYTTPNPDFHPPIRTEDLKALFDHDAVALHIKNYYPSSHATELGKYYHKLAMEGKAKNWKVSTSKGLESSDVATIGTPRNMMGGENAEEKKEKVEESTPSSPSPSSSSSTIITPPTSLEEFFDEARHRFTSNRFLPLSGNPIPYLHPLDKLRLELDEAWPSGCTIARSSSSSPPSSKDDTTTTTTKPYNAGLPRVMNGPTRWRKGFIHVDDLSPLSSKNGTFSSNIYLNVPPPESCSFPETFNGGMLQIWPLKWNKSSFYRNAITISSLTSQDPTLQATLRAKLGKPVELEVEEGDLVILCVQRPHAVVGFQGGTRVSLQSFLEVGEGGKILMDS